MSEFFNVLFDPDLNYATNSNSLSYAQELENKLASINNFKDDNKYTALLQYFSNIAINEEEKEKQYCKKVNLIYNQGIITDTNTAEVIKNNKIKELQSLLLENNNFRGFTSGAEYIQRLRYLDEKGSGSRPYEIDDIEKQLLDFLMDDSQEFYTQFEKQFLEAVAAGNGNIPRLSQTIALSIIHSFIATNFRNPLKQLKDNVEDVIETIKEGIKSLDTEKHTYQTGLEKLIEKTQEFITAGIFQVDDDQGYSCLNCLVQDYKDVIEEEKKRLRAAGWRDVWISKKLNGVLQQAVFLLKNNCLSEKDIESCIQIRTTTSANTGELAETIRSMTIPTLTKGLVRTMQTGKKTGGKADTISILFDDTNLQKDAQLYGNIFKGIQEIANAKTNEQWSTRDLEKMNKLYSGLFQEALSKEKDTFLVYESAKEYNSKKSSGFSGGTPFKFDTFIKHIQAIAKSTPMTADGPLEDFKIVLFHLATNFYFSKSNTTSTLKGILGLFSIGLLFDDGLNIIQQLQNSIINEEGELLTNQLGSKDSRLKTLHVFYLDGKTVTVSFLIKKMIEVLNNTLANINGVLKISVEGGGHFKNIYDTHRDNHKETKNQLVTSSEILNSPSLQNSWNNDIRIKIEFLAKLNELINALQFNFDS